MSGPPSEGEPAWYDIEVAGKRFNIASRHGEAHIREVERLLSETVEAMDERVPGQSTLNLALLTALNLADQLLLLRQSKSGEQEEWSNKLESLLVRLNDTLASDSGDRNG